MATAVGRVDEFVKDYLIYRGLSTTLKTLEIELRNEKEKGFRVDKIVEQLQNYVSSYDLPNLRDYWNFLNSRLFARLEQRYMSSVRKLEVGLLKYYLVNASQNNKQDKILEFFDRMTEILQSQVEFKEWFAFPFVRNPRENSHFTMYFTVQWQETFFLSLHNFLSVILQAMPGPVLLSFEAEYRQIRDLQDENDKLKVQIKSLGEKPDLTSKMTNRESYLSDRSHMDLVYDFSSLGEKPPVKGNKVQSLEPAAVGHVTDTSTNHNTVEMSPANQKMKKIEDAKQKRKELFEASTKVKEEKVQKPPEVKQDVSTGYNRSLSESGVDTLTPKYSPRGTRRTVSKSVLETKSSMYSGTSGTSDSMETVSPLATATLATMLGTGGPSKAEEMQTFPLTSSVTEPEQPATSSTETKTLETRLIWFVLFYKLLLGNRSGNIRLFDVKEMKSFYEATADASYPRIVTLCSNPASPMFVCSATSGHPRSSSFSSDIGPSHDSRAGKLTVWDLKTMKTDKTLPLEPGSACINSCSFNHNGQLLITGGADGMIRLFDVSQEKCISQWQAHHSDIRNIQYSADYNSCYSLGNDGKMSEWSMHKTGLKLRDLPLHQGAVPNFSQLESGNTKEVPVGKLLALDSDGHYLMSCNDTSAEIYRLIKEDPGLLYMMDLRGHRSSLITTVDWSPNIDTKICLTGYLDGKIIVSTLLSQ
ncbi:WD repeat-containing protein 91-like [Ruditapes philippinarum]|uniref:WD repeat-containing protein 91-like n=1 Tax=Ruditapes philippinarum TaxID=129788 RepID=UPI00295BD6A4|nr:WD repeat-containing protein 91-like [Ruditapes philippinarum]